MNERLVPAMGVLAAFIFAAQMLNFPVAGGTSGHLIGGALAAIVLGPAAAILVLTAVVALQALLFQDGGLVALGVNVLNMAVISCLVAYLVFRFTDGPRRSLRGMAAPVFVAAWASVVVSAFAAACELSLSGTTPFAVAAPAMMGTHALIGIGEGLITVAALSLIRASRPDIIATRETGPAAEMPGTIGLRWWAGAYVVSLLVALLAPLASGSPDGLERVAEDKGFIASAIDVPYELIADYALPGVENEAVATILAGLIGATVVFLLVAAAVWALRRRPRVRAPEATRGSTG